MSAGAALHFAPQALGLPEGPPSCVPCDPATLPGIDRWAVRPVSTSADVGSDIAIIAVVGGTALAGLSGLPAEQWKGNLAVFANTATWTYATAEWIKVLVRRERPVMYTADAEAAASDRTSQMSLPSGHTARRVRGRHPRTSSCRAGSICRTANATRCCCTPEP